MYKAGFPGGSVVKKKAIHLAMQETWVGSLGQKDPLKKEMATHSSIPAWEIPWTGEPGGLVDGVTKESEAAYRLKQQQYFLLKYNIYTNRCINHKCTA